MKSFLWPNWSVSPEEQRADAGPGHVRRGAEPGYLALRDVQAAARHAQLTGDVPDDRDFKAVQDPDRAKPDHDHPVPS
jgi:hypothetical protein